MKLGRVPLKDEYIIKLSEYFNVSTDYLLGKTNKKKIEPQKEDEESIELMAFYNGYKDMSIADKEIIKATFDAIVKKNKENKKK